VGSLRSFRLLSSLTQMSRPEQWTNFWVALKWCLCLTVCTLGLLWVPLCYYVGVATPRFSWEQVIEHERHGIKLVGIGTLTNYYNLIPMCLQIVFRDVGITDHRSLVNRGAQSREDRRLWRSIVNSRLWHVTNVSRT
jgi:hypothetical protein